MLLCLVDQEHSSSSGPAQLPFAAGQGDAVCAVRKICRAHDRNVRIRDEVQVLWKRACSNSHGQLGNSEGPECVKWLCGFFFNF